MSSYGWAVWIGNALASSFPFKISVSGMYACSYGCSHVWKYTCTSIHMCVEDQGWHQAFSSLPLYFVHWGRISQLNTGLGYKVRPTSHLASLILCLDFPGTRIIDIKSGPGTYSSAGDLNLMPQACAGNISVTEPSPSPTLSLLRRATNPFSLGVRASR